LTVNILHIIGLVCILGILQTYLFYPLFLIAFGKKKSKKPDYSTNYSVGVIIAAYNEENVLEKKLESILNSDYHLEKISIYVGSDASTDRTNEIVQKFSGFNKNIHLRIFPGRMGKAAIINELAKDCKDEILVLTDANVFFTEKTISNLVRHFSRNTIHQVCANILKTSEKNIQIQGLEKRYLLIENLLKSRESNTWGFVMGAEGGCYAIRNKSYSPVPKNFFMDDFYVTMRVISNGGNVLFDNEAICYEDLPVESSEEFKRKVRISIGNYQNLIEFKHLLWPFWKPVSFAFLSHKVLRWLTPFLLIFLLLISVLLIKTHSIFLYFSAIQLMLILTPLLIPFIKSLKPILFIAHFYNMNLALLIGFFKYVKGVKSSVWQPTQRTKNSH
jgi:cellulose synthase/poly-beta-1,6-N-acetylglucosamine synthase-like glycosyltransferase